MFHAKCIGLMGSPTNPYIEAGNVPCEVYWLNGEPYKSLQNSDRRLFLLHHRIHGQKSPQLTVGSLSVLRCAHKMCALSSQTEELCVAALAEISPFRYHPKL